jgi:hypothetical protein
LVGGGAHHNGWPVITGSSRLFITDENWTMVSVYKLKDGLRASPFVVLCQPVFSSR